MKRLLTNFNNKFLFLLILFNSIAIASNCQNLDISFLENFSYSDTIAVPIYLDNVIEVGAITTGITFDETEVEFIDIQKKTDIAGTVFYNLVNEKIILAWFSLTPITVSDTFAIVYLKRKQDICNTSLSWEILPNQLISDVLGTPITTNYISGTGHFIKAESPNLIYPSLNATNVSINTQFRWFDHDLSCVENYRYQIATDPNFINLEIDSSLTDTVFTAIGLQELVNYYWRVGKVDAAQNVYWSTGQSFLKT